jgi:RNase P/RNase MRP subunit POP5
VIYFISLLTHKSFSWSDEDLDVEITELSFRMSIQQALETIFGRVGAACYINVLGWSQYHNEGIIKVKQR